jgi:hypothetical protein
LAKLAQITSDLRKSCQAKNQTPSKIFRFSRNVKCGIGSSSRPDQRGARDRHERGAGSDGRGSAFDERRGSVRQRRVVLTPRCWRLRWQQYKAHRGERVISRKAIAQGMSDCLRCPVCSCAHFLPNLRMRPRVQRASGIPCALWIWRAGSYWQTSGAMRRENAASYLSTSRRTPGPIRRGLCCWKRKKTTSA